MRSLEGKDISRAVLSAIGPIQLTDRFIPNKRNGQLDGSGRDLPGFCGRDDSADQTHDGEPVDRDEPLPIGYFNRHLLQ
jgi:hypothetical protein